MDKERQIRFLYPPIIFLTSIAVGLYCDGTKATMNFISTFLNNQNNVTVIIALLGVGSLILLLGFLIGTITLFLLRLICFKNRFNYEIWLTERAYAKIGDKIFENTKMSIQKKERLFAGVTFDHIFISSKGHQWIIRRWNSFFICASSAVAILMSIIIGFFFNIRISAPWLTTDFVFFILFVLQSYISWKETMKMIEFQLKVKGDNSKSTEDNPR